VVTLLPKLLGVNVQGNHIITKIRTLEDTVPSTYRHLYIDDTKRGKPSHNSSIDENIVTKSYQRHI